MSQERYEGCVITMSDACVDNYLQVTAVECKYCTGYYYLQLTSHCYHKHFYVNDLETSKGKNTHKISQLKIQICLLTGKSHEEGVHIDETEVTDSA